MYMNARIPWILLSLAIAIVVVATIAYF